MNRTITAIAVAASLGATALTTACQKQASTTAPPQSAAKVSESDAAATADASQAAWKSMDAATIDALYAPDIVGFDPVAPPLSTDRANWTKLQQGFAGMKFDQIDVPVRKIQILDGDTFVVSGVANFTSKDGPIKAMPMRFTDVYHRQPDGRFLIVSEHVSAVPAAAAKTAG